jgi:5-methylcytosine-specific restriction endonuclease McrA
VEFSPLQVKNRSSWKVTKMSDDAQARRFRGSQAWKDARARVVAAANKDGAPCAICGRPIMWHLPKLHPLSATVDHIQPLKTIDLATAEGRRLAVDPTLLRIAHRGCNSAVENRSRGRNAPVVARPAPRTAVVPVCDGRACACEWIGGDRDQCSKVRECVPVLLREVAADAA